jgi:hypothetical protein
MANTRTAPAYGLGASWAVDSTGNIDYGGNRNLSKSVAIVAVGTATVTVSLNYNGTWVVYNNGGLGGTTSLNAISMTAGQTLSLSNVGPCDGIRVNFSAIESTAAVYFVEA